MNLFFNGGIFETRRNDGLKYLVETMMMQTAV